MVCATAVMRPGGQRIGRIVGDIALPRTIPMVTAFLAGSCAIVVGVAAFLLSGSPLAIGIGLGIGGAIGYALATFSPLRGESLLTYLALSVRVRRRRLRVDGRRALYGVGAAVANRAPAGPVVLGRSAVRVDPRGRDERGVLNADQGP